MKPITIPDKKTGDELTAAEFMQIMDALRDGTRDIRTRSIFASPGSISLGPSFRMSNGVEAVSFKLGNAAASDAVGLNVKYDSAGSKDPAYFKLSSRTNLDVNLTSTETLTGDVDVAYTTNGDNLTYDFDFMPRSAGTLRVQYWLGTDDTGVLVFDEVREVLSNEIDNAVPFGVGNPYILPQGTELFARFSGVDLAGNASGIPYFVSYVQGFELVELGLTAKPSVVTATSTADECTIDNDGAVVAVDNIHGQVTLTAGDAKFFTVNDVRGSFADTACTVLIGNDTYILNKSASSYLFYLEGGAWKWTERSISTAAELPQRTIIHNDIANEAYYKLSTQVYIGGNFELTLTMARQAEDSAFMGGHNYTRGYVTGAGNISFMVTAANADQWEGAVAHIPVGEVYTLKFVRTSLNVSLWINGVKHTDTKYIPWSVYIASLGVNHNYSRFTSTMLYAKLTVAGDASKSFEFDFDETSPSVLEAADGTTYSIQYINHENAARELYEIDGVKYINVATNPTMPLVYGAGASTYKADEVFTGCADALPGTAEALEKVGMSIVGGDKTGNTRGDGSVDIQSGRSYDYQVASGDLSLALGRNNRVDGDYSVGLGVGNTTSGSQSFAGGYSNLATNVGAVSMGVFCEATHSRSQVFGHTGESTADNQVVLCASSSSQEKAQLELTSDGVLKIMKTLDGGSSWTEVGRI